MTVLKPYTLRVALLIAGLGVGVAVSARSEILAWRNSTTTPDCDDLRHVTDAGERR